MTQLSRRSILKGASAASIVGVSGVSTARADDKPIGSWAALSDMPFATQEIYPAPFWRKPSTIDSMKPEPFNILMNAGGLAPGEPNNVTDKVTYYDPLEDRWGFATPLPSPRHHIALVNHNGYMLGVGGFARDGNGGWQSRTNVWKIDRLDGVWQPMASIPTPQYETRVVSLGGYVHVVSGRSPAGSRNREWRDQMDTSAHWIYDMQSDSWQTRTPILTKRNSAASAIVRNILYVIGGRTVNGGNTNVVEAYDPFADRWQRVAPMTKAQGELAAGVNNNKIYAFGGEYFEPEPGGVFAECWEYDPREDKWRSVAAMPRRRHGLGAVSLNNSIYVLGGAARVGGDGTSTALDRFDI